MKGVINIRILSFDQAINKTGVCIIDDNLFYHTIIDNSKLNDKKEKIESTYKQIKSKILENNPDIVVFEDVALQSSPSVLIELARLQGFIIGVCNSCKKEYMILKPTVWRKALGFKQGKLKRKDLKKEAIDYVKQVYNEDVNSDEADAICIALAYINLIKGDNKYENCKD